MNSSTSTTSESRSCSETEESSGSESSYESETSCEEYTDHDMDTEISQSDSDEEKTKNGDDVIDDVITNGDDIIANLEESIWYESSDGAESDQDAPSVFCDNLEDGVDHQVSVPPSTLPEISESDGSTSSDDSACSNPYGLSDIDEAMEEQEDETDAPIMDVQTEPVINPGVDCNPSFSEDILSSVTHIFSPASVMNSSVVSVDSPAWHSSSYLPELRPDNNMLDECDENDPLIRNLLSKETPHSIESNLAILDKNSDGTNSNISGDSGGKTEQISVEKSAEGKCDDTGFDSSHSSELLFDVDRLWSSIKFKQALTSVKETNTLNASHISDIVREKVIQNRAAKTKSLEYCEQSSERIPTDLEAVPSKSVKLHHQKLLTSTPTPGYVKYSTPKPQDVAESKRTAYSTGSLQSRALSRKEPMNCQKLSTDIDQSLMQSPILPKEVARVSSTRKDRRSSLGKRRSSSSRRRSSELRRKGPELLVQKSNLELSNVSNISHESSYSQPGSFLQAVPAFKRRSLLQSHLSLELFDQNKNLSVENAESCPQKCKARPQSLNLSHGANLNECETNDPIPQSRPYYSSSQLNQSLQHKISTRRPATKHSISLNSLLPDANNGQSKHTGSTRSSLSNIRRSDHLVYPNCMLNKKNRAPSSVSSTSESDPSVCDISNAEDRNPAVNNRRTSVGGMSIQEKKEVKRQKKRARVIEELLYTEGTYQKHLELLYKNFQEPLRESRIIPDSVTVTLFSNVHQIIQINKELVEHLQNLSIGQAFLKLGPFLKLYSTYAKNHEHALAVLMDWDQKSPEFSQFRRQQEEKPEMNGLKLNALLITPVQRIPRYKLLLEELLHNTPPDHKDFDAIKEAVGQVASVANHINDHIKQQENFMKMLAIQKSLTGHAAPKILIPGRMHIKDGPLKKVSKNGGRCYERRFFLFSDILMYAKPKLLESGAHHSYVCCCILPLQHCLVTRVFGHSQGQGALFNIKCKSESLLLLSDQIIVNSWITALDKAISEFNDSRQTLRKVSSAKQPLRKAAIAKLLKHEKQSDPFTAAVRRTPNRASQRTLKRVLRESNSPVTSPSKVKVTEDNKHLKVKATDENITVSSKSPKQEKEPAERQTLMEALGCLSPCGLSRRWRNSKRPSVRSYGPDENNDSRKEEISSPAQKTSSVEISTPIRTGGQAFQPASPAESPIPLPSESQDVSGTYNDVWRLADDTYSVMETPGNSPAHNTNQPIRATHLLATPSASPALKSSQPIRARDCTTPNSNLKLSRTPIRTPGVRLNKPNFESSLLKSAKKDAMGVKSSVSQLGKILRHPSAEKDKSFLTTPTSSPVHKKVRKERPVSTGSDTGSASGSEKGSPSRRHPQKVNTALDAAAEVARAVYPASPQINYGAACTLQ